MDEWLATVMAGGVAIGDAYVHEFTYGGTFIPEAHYSIGWDVDGRTSFTLTGVGNRRLAALFGVPPWLIGIGKRPPQPKVRGQRGTGHHRPHRRA